MTLSNKSSPKPSKPRQTVPFRFAFEALGTHWQVDAVRLPVGLRQAVLQEKIALHLDAFDQQYSRFRSDSLVTHMANKAGRYQLPDDAQPLMVLYQDLYGITDGKMTPLIGQTLSDAGYDAEYSLQSKSPVPPSAWDDVLQYDFPSLTLKRPALLDFGAAGKGYAVDQLAALLRDEGLEGFTVDAGGDMLHCSAQPLRVGLEHPDAPGQVVGVATVASGTALCGSAGNRRAWGAYHHTLDPQSLESPRHIRALWAMADTALLADAMTTALYFVEPSVLLKRYTFEYAILYDDYRLAASPGFAAEYFTEEA